MMDNKESMFINLVREHKRTIYTVCYLFTNQKEDVEDLFQEILIRIWNGMEGFEKRSNMNTWIYKVALNTALNEQAIKGRCPQTLPLNMEINPYDETDTSDVRISELHERILRLEMADRALVMLWLEDMSYDEIASIMGISVQNVGVRLVRIKEKLIKMANNK